MIDVFRDRDFPDFAAWMATMLAAWLVHLTSA
jgi:hypothetical protein